MFKSSDMDNWFNDDYLYQYEKEKENKKFDEMFNGNRYALITYDKFMYEYEDSEIEMYRKPIINLLNDGKFHGIIKIKDGNLFVINFKRTSPWTNYNWKWDENIVKTKDINKDYQNCIDRLIDKGYRYGRRIREI